VLSDEEREVLDDLVRSKPTSVRLALRARIVLLAAELGVSAASVSRHWRKNGLKPHLVRGFKVSRDPRFVEKLEGIVDLYMAPPEHALVLCCVVK
jgi:hypothetical protein